MMNQLSRTYCILGTICLGLLAGCARPDGPSMLTTKGTVTFKGEPIEEGRINFRELDGEMRPYSAPIKNGAFSIESTAGKMRVEVYASRIIPGKFDTSNLTEEPVGEMYIPERYNSRSELTHEVTRGAPSPTFTLEE